MLSRVSIIAGLWKPLVGINKHRVMTEMLGRGERGRMRQASAASKIIPMNGAPTGITTKVQKQKKRKR